MKMNPLGRTGIEVTELCLGTMLFGTQVNEADAHKQIDMALDGGVTFVDTAEMYPVNPITAETQGSSEEYVGSWIAKSGRRGDVVVATKHSGTGLKHIREGGPITAESIPEAVEGSLKRLQTDYIDLYQFHWPNRGSYMFRQNWKYDPSAQDRASTIAHMQDALGALQREVEKGRIRAFGLSNESAWGTTKWLDVAEDVGGPRVATVQNEYSLLCRLYDTDMAEMSVNEDVGLLAFSPLATGLLTGKYQGGVVPAGSRKTLQDTLGGRTTLRAFAAVDAYVDVAERHSLDLVHMALAFTLQRPFMCSSIFGATTLPQLEHILKVDGLRLSDEVMAELDQVHIAHPMPF
ncbi:aldo/keto reductase [Shimia abyssi]|uniref:Aryl-alcohol dehydrogenase-like predicted oxidoreductase n=1 Tax=Shimia abyssi TaxID=1662395 RepID=A0A2P8FE91_9RHOB|nr:aldo/keto reductase [Shimia abyssi]PSL20039.1 aryl-alcohol dehydrogenase-like predicted oxidoreductase [Shimia abyssi]